MRLAGSVPACRKWSPAHYFSIFARLQRYYQIGRCFYSETRYLASLARHQMASPTIAGIVGVCTDARQSRENLLVGTKPHANGDLNNVASMRAADPPKRNPDLAYRSLSLQQREDDAVVRAKYRPFLLSDEVHRSDWISRLELATVTELAYNDLLRTGSRLKVLVLYGSLRKRSAHSHTGHGGN